MEEDDNLLTSQEASDVPQVGVKKRLRLQGRTDTTNRTQHEDIDVTRDNYDPPPANNQEPMATPQRDDGPPEKNRLDVFFVDEDGAWVSFGAECKVEICRLFERYSKTRSIPMILLEFRHQGKLLPINCDDALSQLKTTEDVTIYTRVKRIGSVELSEFIAMTTHEKAIHLSPASAVNRKVARDIDGDGVIVYGIITGYCEEGDDMFWRANFTNGQVFDYGKRVLIVDMRHYYYEKDGLVLDALEYLNGALSRHSANMQGFIAGVRSKLHTPSESILEALKLEQEVKGLLFHAVDAQKFEVREEKHHHQLCNFFTKLREGLNNLLNTRRELTRAEGPRKPLLQVGDIVCAKWRPPTTGINRHLDPHWRQATLTFVADADNGLPLSHDVKFDSGHRSGGLGVREVISRDEYHVMNNFGGSLPSGVRHIPGKHLDDSSGVKHIQGKHFNDDDKWAKERGWYALTIDGIEETFFYLSDALRARDAYVVSQKDFDLWGENVCLTNDWVGLLKAQKDVLVDEQEMFLHQEMRIILILIDQRLIDPTMKKICQALRHWMHPERWSRFITLERRGIDPFREHACVGWKVAQKHYLAESGADVNEENLTQMKDTLLTHALFQQCVVEGMGLRQMCHFFVCAKGSLEEFLNKAPFVRQWYDSTASFNQDDIVSYFRKSAEDCADVFRYINIDNGKSTKRHYLKRNQPFKDYLAKFANERGTTIKSFRIEHDEKPLFLSAMGKKTLDMMNIEEQETIRIHYVKSIQAETKPVPQRRAQNPSKRKKKKGNNKKSRRKPPVQIVPPKDEEEKLRQQHSKAISRVFDEAEPRFREIRQKLNALNLERTKPKQKKKKNQPKPAKSKDEPVENPQSDSLGGKAGKSQLIVLVGESTNLYNTNKHSSPRTAMVDLHGLSEKDAIHKLDECLPSWIDTAMKGSYPWVIPVRIVCGGGNQILAEAVERWIKKNENVANAPKSMMYS